MTDWKALCAELAHELQGYKTAMPMHDRSLLDRARAALSQPEPEVVGPTDEEIMGLMPQQMHDDIAAAIRAMAKQEGIDSTPAKGVMRIMLNRHVVDLARAVLARWGHPAPAPAEGEVAKLAEWLRDDLELHPAEKRRVADLLEQRHPTPVPVAERLPGPEDCDAEGRCWLHLPDMGTEPLWRLTDPSMRSRYHSHWLPATALPMPQGEVE